MTTFTFTAGVWLTVIMPPDIQSIVAVVVGRGREPMNEEHNYAEWSPVSRRQALIGVGSLAAGATTYSVIGSDGARAEVTLGALDAQDGELTSDAADPVVDATILYRYDVGSAPIRSLCVGLTIAGDVVAERELSTTTSVLENDVELSGHVIDSDAFETSDFEPAVADSVNHEITVGVVFEAREGDDSVIVAAETSDTAELVVSHPQESEFVADVGGTATFADADN